MATYLRLHAPSPDNRGPHPQCQHPDEKVYCRSCDTTFVCGNAPHTDSKALCPSCGGAEGLSAASTRGVITLTL